MPRLLVQRDEDLVPQTEKDEYRQSAAYTVSSYVILYLSCFHRKMINIEVFEKGSKFLFVSDWKLSEAEVEEGYRQAHHSPPPQPIGLHKTWLT